MTIRIDELDTTAIPQRDHEFPAMRDGITVKLTAAQILALIQKGDLSADVLASLDLADTALQEIANTSVTNAMLASMAQARIKGRAAGAGTGAPVDLTAEQVKAILALPFTKFYESGEQTITAAGAVNVNHGLGEEPKLIQIHLVCKTAELGYAVGEKILIPPQFQTTTGDGRGLALRWNSTQVFWRYGAAANTFQLIRPGDGGIQGITNANFRVVVRAWA